MWLGVLRLRRLLARFAGYARRRVCGTQHLHPRLRLAYYATTLEGVARFMTTHDACNCEGWQLQPALRADFSPPPKSACNRLTQHFHSRLRLASLATSLENAARFMTTHDACNCEGRQLQPALRADFSPPPLTGCRPLRGLQPKRQ